MYFCVFLHDYSSLITHALIKYVWYMFLIKKLNCHTELHCTLPYMLHVGHSCNFFLFHFASAFVAVIFSQLMASSSASWRLNKPLSSFVSGHESTMCSMVCCSPQSQNGDNHAVTTATHVRLGRLHSSDRPLARDVRGNMLSPVTDVCGCVGDWSPVTDGMAIARTSCCCGSS